MSLPTASCARAGWPLERILFALAGTVTLVSAALAAVLTPWFLVLTAFVGTSQWLYVLVGACPASVVIRRLTGARSVRLPRHPPGGAPMSDLGPIGRLGHWTATHFRAVADRLDRARRRPRRLRAQGRDGPLRRRLGDHRLRVGQGA